LLGKKSIKGIFMSTKQYDIAIIGGGIVGMGTALELATNHKLSILVIEAEEELAQHQTGHNSGVIHSGLYYKPGSLKAKNCVEGANWTYNFCKEHGISVDNCGKVVVATCEEEIPRLNDLEQRGIANGLIGLTRLGPEQIKEHEPHVNGIDGLFVPATGIVDFIGITQKMAEIVKQHDGVVKTNTVFRGLEKESGGLVLETSQGEFHCKYLINCGGLQSDRIAKMCGVDPKSRIIPFRGEYYELIPEKHHLVNNLIYPVPDPQFPFLGVHFTRMVLGGVEAGPNAVFALKREGYKKSDVSIRDTFENFVFPGFWKMALKYWKMGMGEIYRSMSKKAFVKALQRLVPELDESDVQPAGSGVRAQALDPNGKLVDDFRIVEAERMVHVVNAPSPAATAGATIGKEIAELAIKNFHIID
jgi:(S)-2-hydroxyglutarate dehydrogenase